MSVRLNLEILEDRLAAGNLTPFMSFTPLPNNYLHGSANEAAAYRIVSTNGDSPARAADLAPSADESMEAWWNVLMQTSNNYSANSTTGVTDRALASFLAGLTQYDNGTTLTTFNLPSALSGDNHLPPSPSALQWYGRQLRAVDKVFASLAGANGTGSFGAGGRSTPSTGGGGGAPVAGGAPSGNALFQMLQALEARNMAAGAPEAMSTPTAPVHTEIAAASVNPALASPAILASNRDAQPLVTNTPDAVDDTLGNNNYIARPSMMFRPPSTFNVSADAGVLTNDVPGVGGDRLIAGPVGGPVPALGGFSVIVTALGGTVDLGADGSFNYKPPAGVSGATDTFGYEDTEITSTGKVIGTSKPATVDIGIMNFTPTPLLPSVGMGGITLDGGDSPDNWPKYHATTDNQGIAIPPSTRTAAVALTWTTPPLPGGDIEGSPITGSGDVFIEDGSNLVALADLVGNPVWTSAVPIGEVDSAPAAIVNPIGGDYVVVGEAQGGSLLAFNTGNASSSGGSVAGSFLAQETYGSYSNSQGPIKSSPNVLADPVMDPAIPPGENSVVFGVDAGQGAGMSGGRLYAVRADGSVLWETLLAGNIDGSVAVAAPSTMFPDGLVFVATGDNNWGGRPDNPGQGQGRVYELDGLTGAVLAENFVSGDTVNSPVFVPGTPTPGSDPKGTNTGKLFVTAGSAGVQSTVAAFNPVIVAPPGLLESPAMTTVWTETCGLQPTAPTLSTDGTAIYFGDQRGLEAYSTTTGANVWTVMQDAARDPLTSAIFAAPAVVPMAGAPATSQIIFGTNTATPFLYAFSATGTGAPTELWALASPDPNNPWNFNKSSPAIDLVLGGGGPPAIIYIGTTQGIVLAVK